MADSPATFSALINTTKRVYGPRIEEQVNKSAFLYKLFDEDTQADFMGEGWFFPVTDEGGQSIGNYGDNEELADSQAESYNLAKIDTKQAYAVIQVTGKAIAATRKNMQAFLKAKQGEIEAKTKSLISDLNRQCYGDSYGTLGAVASDAANTITFGGDVNMLWFRKNMKIDIFDATRTTKRNGAAGTKKEGRSITAINYATRTITYSGGDLSGSIIATDVVFREDERLNLAGTVEGKELNGFRFMGDDGTDSLATFQNVSRTSVAVWKANRLFNAGTLRPLTLDLLQQLVDAVTTSSTEEPTHLLMGLGQRRMYLNTLWYDVRYEPQQLKGGFKTLQYNNMDVLVDKDMLPQQVVCFVRNKIKKYELQPLGILDHAGVGAERIGHFDTYEMLIGMYGNLGSTRPNAIGRLGDLTEP